MKNSNLLIVFLCVTLLICCWPFERKYNTGTFPETPVNMSDLNSEFDDYNSASPIIGNTTPLCFSSKRNSNGNNFDITYKLLDVIMSRSDGKITVGENKSGNLDVYIENENINDAINKINTSHEELGPYLIYQGKKNNGTNINGRYESYIFLYSTNEGGDHDIKFLHNLSAEKYTNPEPVLFLNSAKDDAYPNLNQDSSILYFCSNRATDFDIYKVELPKGMALYQSLADKTPKVVSKDTVLSSASDDKCPYITNNLLVFSSNRPGGFGGFDLYYSIFSNGTWSAPINFGSKINSEYDEYRPIVKPMYAFTNDFMIFSSNRPGGKGGFDLYYVGIARIK